MNRLRVRVELNRRKAGVPMDELVSVVEETRKFFHLLAEDVQIPAAHGEWLASNFDPESLNFTAEYAGAASDEQIRAFGSAFGGATSLRRETINQFTHIADFIGEDELVGFGLYQSDQESEPSDWRCLSRRDALRFADEIRLLAKVAGEAEPEASLPAVNGSVGGRRLFKDRRERETLATDPSKWIREVESSLSRRISLIEDEVEAQARKMQGVSKTQEVADERFVKLLGAMESFWSQAPRQLPAPNGSEPAALGLATSVEAPSAAVSVPTRTTRRSWPLGLALAAGIMVLAAAGTLEVRAHWPQWSDLIGHDQTPEAVASPIPFAPVSPQSTASLAAPVPTEVPQPILATPVPTASGSPRREPVEMMRQISLEIPDELRSIIAEPVLVNVSVGIDPRGKVTTARIASTKGDGADLLAAEALKAARWFRFRPGNKSTASQTVLTFLFDPEPKTTLPEDLQSGN